MTRPFHTAAGLVVAVAILLPIVTPGPAGASEHKNEIKGLTFNPDQMTIRAGDSVTWVNGDADRHNLQGDGFESKEMDSATSWLSARRGTSPESATRSSSNYASIKPRLGP